MKRDAAKQNNNNNMNFVLTFVASILLVTLLAITSYSEPNATIETLMRILVVSLLWRKLEDLVDESSAKNDRRKRPNNNNNNNNNNNDDDDDDGGDGDDDFNMTVSQRAFVGACDCWWMPLLFVREALIGDEWLRDELSLAAVGVGAWCVMFIFLATIFAWQRHVSSRAIERRARRARLAARDRANVDAANNAVVDDDANDVGVRGESLVGAVLAAPLVVLLQAYTFHALVRAPLLDGCLGAGTVDSLRSRCAAPMAFVGARTTLRSVPLPMPLFGRALQFDVLHFDVGCAMLSTAAQRVAFDVDARHFYAASIGAVALGFVWLLLTLLAVVSRALLPRALADTALAARNSLRPIYALACGVVCSPLLIACSMPMFLHVLPTTLTEYVASKADLSLPLRVAIGIQQALLQSVQFVSENQH